MSLPNQDASAGLSKAMPYIGTGLSALGGFIGASSEARALRTNAAAYGTEAQIASRQGVEAESQQRITGAKVMGREVAAAGEAGAGYGGSTGRLIAQSARNTELDALNIRYKAALQRWSFDAQSGILAQEGRAAQSSAYLKAGASLLRGYSGNYTGASPFQYYPTT